MMGLLGHYLHHWSTISGNFGSKVTDKCNYLIPGFPIYIFQITLLAKLHENGLDVRNLQHERENQDMLGAYVGKYVSHSAI
jgi:hypothetical protein